MVAASLATVTTFGHFVDISKRDIWSHGMASFERSDVSYALVALDFLPPRKMGAALKRLGVAMACGVASSLVGKMSLRARSHKTISGTAS